MKKTMLVMAVLALVAIAGYSEDSKESKEPAELTTGKADYTVVNINDITDRAKNSVIGGKYPKLLWTSGMQGYYNFKVEAKSGKKYYLYALYTSEDSRPCVVKIKGKTFKSAFDRASGSYQKDSLILGSVGPVEAKDGVIDVKIKAKGYAPHFYGFFISETEVKTMTADEFDALGKN